MRKEILEYPLADGFIHHWLVAGPQAIPVEELQRFGNPPDREQIARLYTRAEVGIEGEPIEYGEYRIGGFKDRWRYVRTRPDHLVDLSAFHPAVNFLRAWAYAEINSPVEQEVTFNLTTNGPADLWVNDQPAHRQEHFHDRTPMPVRFRGRLKDGVNRLMVRIEAVAAGECAFSMALRLADFKAGADAEDKVVQIPSGAPSSKHRLKLENLFEDSHIRQDVYARNDEIVVYLPEGKVAATPFVIRLQHPGGPIFAEANRDGTLTEPVQSLGFPFQSPEGSYQLRFMPSPKEFYESNFRISRLRDLYAATNTYSTQPYGTYAERRSECLKDAARRKNNLFGEIAKMEEGRWKDIEEKVVQKAIEDVKARSAGSDIQLCGLLGMLFRYADNNRFPAALRGSIEESVLGFRYWEDEPGSDAMDFRGESRSILFHSCEILAGQLCLKRAFTNANRPGEWHLEKGGRLALEWLQKRAAGGFEEWDSHTGFAEDVLALSTLTSLAENPQIMEMAALMLDKLFFTIAVNSFQGVFGSTHGSTLASQVKTGYREATSGITRLLWGMGIFNEHTFGTVGLACSSYELPPVIAAVAADRSDEMWSKEQHTGGGKAGTVVNKMTFKTPDTMLCSAQDWRPGQKGGREHIWQATLGPMATVFTSHPSCAYEGNGRSPNYWLGNAVLPRVAQWKDMLIAIYQFADDDWMGFTHAYFPVHGMDEHEIRDGWALGRVGDGYIALAAARGLDFKTSGDSAYRELRSPGTPNIWLCQMGRAARDGNFHGFIGKVLALPVQFDGAQVEITGLRGDHLSFGWDYPLLVNGKEQPLGGFKHFDNPYCTCELDAPEMEIHHGENILRLHFEENPEEETHSQA